MARRLEPIVKRFDGDGGQYKEQIWVGGKLQELSDQVGGSCTQHALTKVVEFKHLYSYQQRGELPPFDKLSVQFVVDRSQCKSYDYDNWHSREKSIEAIINDGILAYHDYALWGLRGEGSWIRNDKISNKTRYGVENFDWIKNVGHSVQKYAQLRTALDKGPVYIDFGVDEQYEKLAGFRPHEGGKHGSHAACCVGYGGFRGRANNVPYLVYTNSYGPDWGDNGLGRIQWQFVKTALLPVGLRTFRYPSRRAPPIYDHLVASSSAEGPGPVH